MSLIAIRGGILETIKGDSKSIGYKESALDHTYTTHRLTAEAGLVCYLATDGMTDQLGGSKGIALGNKRFQALLLEHSGQSVAQQQVLLQDRFRAYQGDLERMDDVTVLGFRLW